MITQVINGKVVEVTEAQLEEMTSTMEYFINPVLPTPSSVTARQFKIQLFVNGIKDTVENWIKTQDVPTQISYEYATDFVRTDPYMTAGFSALGYTEDQIDTFYTNASKL